ncbi:MAG: hypothetical protein Q7T04_01375 [Dehalococcoidia bacterium]|nr:hypothetical protein [Dehalococcoidia bacterium]
MATVPEIDHAFLSALASQENIEMFSVADLRADTVDYHRLPAASLEPLHLAIVIGKRVSPTVLDTLEDGPNLIYYHHYRQVNFLLDRVALKIASEIESHGYRALPVAASQLVDWKEQLGHVSHKRLAWLAGLGWRGRNSLLVSEKWGAKVRLASILTNLPLEPAKPLNKDCGSCKRCLDVCPAHAIKDAPADFDRAKCADKLKEFTKTRGIGVSICGLCVKVCCGSAG